MTDKTREFRAPGRIEIGGNHTDHQHGRVLTAAINLETRCIAEPNGTDVIHIVSEGFGEIDADVSLLSPQEGERGTAAALVRGVAAWFKERGFAIGGFNAKVSSEVPAGSGLSSSAAFEVVIGETFSGLFGSGVRSNVTPLDKALAGQYAESVFFGKPCGLMDQCASAFGGLMTIDFKNPKEPVVTPIQADFSGYGICTVDTGGSHANLTEDYADIPLEMRDVADFFDKECLRDVERGWFDAQISELREEAGDRAVLRAIHFFEENERVTAQAAALANHDMGAFLELVNESGRSSISYLQNVYTSDGSQGLTIALALSEGILKGKGAWRVHGGGFAGTILAIVPNALKKTYEAQMNAVFGDGACLFLNIGGGGAV